MKEFTIDLKWSGCDFRYSNDRVFHGTVDRYIEKVHGTNPGKIMVSEEQKEGYNHAANTGQMGFLSLIYVIDKDYSNEVGFCSEGLRRHFGKIPKEFWFKIEL